MKNKTELNEKKLKRKNKRKFIELLAMIILNTFGTFFLAYGLILLTGIENTVRYLVIFILILLWITLLITYLKSYRKKSKKFIIHFIFVILYSIALIVSGSFIIKAYSTITKLSSDTTTYSSSLITLSDNKVDNINDIEDAKVGILSDETSVDGNVLPKEIIKKEKLDNEIVEYDNYVLLIKALIEKEVDYIFAPTTYTYMFQNTEDDELDNLTETTKIIYTKEKTVKKENNTNKSLTEPFTILLMGVDSEAEDISQGVFNGDSLMLLTFNPSTLSTTILSIPRDSYVPIACFDNQRENKITHAAWYGEDCMIKTIENYTQVDIDYYVKINFKGLVKIVDSLGGVEIDVPYSLCEQNSNREWGTNTIYIEKGLQTLTGEQALAYARNRHPNPTYCSSKWTNYTSNDFIRGQHQQEVLKAVLNKLKNIGNLNTVYELLDTISSNMETNMATSEILSLYNIGKDIITKSSGENVEDLISMQRLYLSGVDAYIYDSYLGLTLYNYVIYEDSIADVTEAMKINLGLQEPEVIKEFSFVIDEPYEETVIGKGDYSELPSYQTLPDFTGDSELQARSTAKKLGITLSFKYVYSGSGKVGTVIKQNYAVGTSLSNIKTVTLTVLLKEETTTTTNTTTNNQKTDNEETTTTIDNEEEPTNTTIEEETNETTTEDTE
ncbi:MAG: LCP family protein [Bacilli bacterium]|nr:LCP family protein [Bacilli bacterium]